MHLCNKLMPETFNTITSQQVGSLVESEANLREVIAEMSLEQINQVFKKFRVNVPSEDELRLVRLWRPDLPLEDLM